MPSEISQANTEKYIKLENIIERPTHRGQNSRYQWGKGRREGQYRGRALTDTSYKV